MQIGPIWLMVALLFMSGCGAKHYQTVAEPEIDNYIIEPVILVAFKTLAHTPEGLGFREKELEGARFLTDTLEEKLRDMEIEVLLAPPATGHKLPVEESFDQISAEAQSLGRIHRVPVALFGYVRNYVEREGSAWGAKQPASVDFSVYLVETGGGQLLWEARYHETQKPLFEDLTEFGSFLKRGGRWVTAEDLARTGLDGILKKSPWKKRGKKPQKR